MSNSKQILKLKLANILNLQNLWYSRYRVHNRLRTVLRTVQGCLNYNRIWISKFCSPLSQKYVILSLLFMHLGASPKRVFLHHCAIFFLSCSFLTFFVPKMWKSIFRPVFGVHSTQNAFEQHPNVCQNIKQIYKVYCQFIGAIGTF